MGAAAVVSLKLNLSLSVLPPPCNTKKAIIIYNHCRLFSGEVSALTDDRYTVRFAAMRPALLASIPNHSATSSFHCRFGRPRLRLPSMRPSITIRSKQSCRFKCPKYFSFCLLMNRNNTPDVTPCSIAIDPSVQLTPRIVL